MIVVGAGAQTPLGLDLPQTSFLLRAGFTAMGPARWGPEGETVTVCKQTALDDDCRGAARAIALASPALTEACSPLAHLAPRAKLLLCLDAVEKTEAEELARALVGALPWPATLEISLRGAAATCFALPALVAELGRSLDCVVLGGVHSDCDPRAIARLLAADRLYADDNLDAVLPGETAAFVVIASPAFAKQSLLEPLGRIDGIGSALEEARFDNDQPAAPARGATAAIRAATASLESSGLHAGWILSDVSFEAWRLREWQTVFLRARPVLGPPFLVDNVAHRLGALGAAAGPLFTALACQAWRSGHAASPHVLALMGSEGGERGALSLSRVSSEAR